MSLVASFETCLRRRGDVLIGRRHYVLMKRHRDIPIRRHGDVTLSRLGCVPLRRHWVFHLRRTYDVTGTYRETSLRRRHNVDVLGIACYPSSWWDWCISEDEKKETNKLWR